MRIRERLANLVFGPEVSLNPEVTAGLLLSRVKIRGARWIPVLGGIFGRMRGPAAAVTLGRTIVVHPDARLTRRLLRHELEHVRQWEEDPLFPIRYTAESLRVGYLQNCYEQLARAAEREPVIPDSTENLA